MKSLRAITISLCVLVVVGCSSSAPTKDVANYVTPNVVDAACGQCLLGAAKKRAFHPSVCIRIATRGQRARAAGYPERFAQEALGHASAAIHRAYAKSVRVELPPLEEYEQRAPQLVAA